MNWLDYLPWIGFLALVLGMLALDLGVFLLMFSAFAVPAIYQHLSLIHI